MGGALAPRYTRDIREVLVPDPGENLWRRKVAIRTPLWLLGVEGAAARGRPQQRKQRIKHARCRELMTKRSQGSRHVLMTGASMPT